MLRPKIDFRPLVFAAFLVVACRRGDSAPTRDTMQTDPARSSLITAPSKAYKVVPLSSAGSITGTVDFNGTIPAALQVSSDPSCGKPPANTGIAHSGTHIGGAVVWLTDIREGKTLPQVRRFELTNDHCALDPHVQVILINGALNVTSEDRVLHLDRFIDVATGRTIALAPFNDEGEVVPFDHTFTEPAEIEVICDLHPSAHAWLAVLDHPYYATTSAVGAFTIDGVPPGRYHLRAWHPALGVANDSVTVIAGQPVNLALRLIPEAATRAAPIRVPRTGPGGGFVAPKPSAGADSAAADSARADSVAADTTRRALPR